MPTSPASLTFNTEFYPETGVPVSVAPGLLRITAPNSGPYTFTGTNSFLIGYSELTIVDPGPVSGPHLAAILSAVDGRRVKSIILTHTHKDHSLLAPRMKSETGAGIWCAGPHRLSRPLGPLEINPMARSCDWALRPDRTLNDNEKFDCGEVGVTAVTTPGHCANHIALALPGLNCVLTGDHVMGWNSTLVATPDGSMADYLHSLEKLQHRNETIYHPAHGGPINDGPLYAAKLGQHRRFRNHQILDCLGRRPQTLTALQKQIYPDLPFANRFAARLTLRAHLEYLLDGRKIARRPGVSGWSYSLA